MESINIYLDAVHRSILFTSIINHDEFYCLDERKSIATVTNCAGGKVALLTSQVLRPGAVTA